MPVHPCVVFAASNPSSMFRSRTTAAATTSLAATAAAAAAAPAGASLALFSNLPNHNRHYWRESQGRYWLRQMGLADHNMTHLLMGANIACFGLQLLWPEFTQMFARVCKAFSLWFALRLTASMILQPQELQWAVCVMFLQPPPLGQYNPVSSSPQPAAAINHLPAVVQLVVANLASQEALATQLQPLQLHVVLMGMTCHLVFSAGGLHGVCWAGLAAAYCCFPACKHCTLGGEWTWNWYNVRCVCTRRVQSWQFAARLHTATQQGLLVQAKNGSLQTSITIHHAIPLYRIFSGLFSVCFCCRMEHQTVVISCARLLGEHACTVQHRTCH